MYTNGAYKNVWELNVSINTKLNKKHYWIWGCLNLILKLDKIGYISFIVSILMCCIKWIIEKILTTIIRIKWINIEIIKIILRTLVIM